MVKIVSLSTAATEIDEDVEKAIQKVIDYHRERKCVGIGVVMIFRNADSVTFGSKAANRREMLGAMTDLLFDYQRDA